MTQRKLITTLEAQRLAADAGLAHLNMGWWRKLIRQGKVDHVTGVVPYLYEDDVQDVIDAAIEAERLKKENA